MTVEPDPIVPAAAEPPRTIEHSRGGHVRWPLREYLESLLVTVVIALFGTTFIVQSFQIPSQSMEPTLQVGDYLLANKFIFGGNGAWYERFLPYRQVRRGEVIVFKFPFADHSHYVKRVIGLPGDRIRIVDQQVYVNGWKLNEPYVIHDATFDDPFGDNFPPASNFILQRGLQPEWAAEMMDHVQHGELVVPPGNYFVMGDNRDHSSDSRYWGFVDRAAFVGRPVVIYWSINATSEDYLNRGGEGTLHGFLTTLLHLPTHTRWHRLLREVH